jgi:hypothetical protein
MSLKALISDVDGTLADTVYLSALAALDLEASPGSRGRGFGDRCQGCESGRLVYSRDPECVDL